MLVVEDSGRSPTELVRAPFVRDRESANRDAVDLLDTGRPLVLPGHVVARAGGEDVDGRMARQPLGDEARVLLRPAVDVGAVALDDDRQLHDSDEWEDPLSPAADAAGVSVEPWLCSSEPLDEAWPPCAESSRPPAACPSIPDW